MSIKISIKTSISENRIKNFVLFTDKEFKINGFSKISLAKQSSYINKIINSNKSKDQKFLTFNLNSYQKVILIKLENIVSSIDNEKKGAEFYKLIKSNSLFDLTFFDINIQETSNKNKNMLDEFFHGVKLKSYEFNKYKSKNKIYKFNFDILYKNKSLISIKIKDMIL